ncbi:WD40 repeat protein [Pyrenophora tritici-repentis]|uniref:WD40 repeat protein n=1 Tax=Pyrenophora tritici-repentis TaxID=45151 RepID=A0A922N3G2_9PLEO|nr:WD40 repeat protein [Pyrenophora tritici-repentis]KAI1667779.1 WD40 repeat protein [Pyrenophora tritici-repentis]KAI1679991.1 WD40 repeat protein [Pyrenophora tritici-repentis]
MTNMRHPLADRSLFIVMPNSIHLRSQLADRTVFECHTLDSIVNARASKDKCGVFAVADGQIVLLYDETRGKNRKYKLKTGDGEPRLLLFSPDSHILYFTTTLSNSVQAYSIPTKELLSPMPSHPSPPHTIAISCNGTILLSASPDPPTIYLQDRRYEGSAPLNFRPTDAHSAVSCAAFQKLTGHIQPPYTNFALGFQDGTLAMYRVLLPSLQERQGEGDTHQMWPFRLQPVRVGVVKGLHKAAMGGLMAVEFIPGYKSRVVSIRHDGKCRLVDFQEEGKVLRTEIKAPVVGDATEDATQIYGPEILIAVGTLAGKVLVFNVLGLLIHEVVLDSPITAVEWIDEMPPPSILTDFVLFRVPESYTMGDNSTRGFSACSGEETSTVKRTIAPPKQAVNQQLGLVQQSRNLSYNGYPYQKSDNLGNKSSHVLRGSPLRMEGLGKRPKQTFFRPRVSAETFNTPGEFTSHQVLPLQLSQPEFQISQARTKPHKYEVPKASRLPRFSALEISLSSSEDSECSETESFTPNARRLRRRTAKLPARQRNGVNTLRPIASRHVTNTPSIISHVPLPSIMKQPPTRESPSGKLTLGKRVMRHMTPQRHVRIASETPSPPLNVPSSSYSRSISHLNEHGPAEESDHGKDSQYSALSTKTTLPPPTDTAYASYTYQDPPTNIYSYPMPDISQYDITTSTSASTSTGDTIHTSLDPRPARSILVRNRTDQDAKSSTLITVAPRPRSTSSAYSRSISEFPKDTDTVDGEVVRLELQHRSSPSSPLMTYPPSGVVFFNSLQAGDGAVDDRAVSVVDMAGLREDQRVLRAEVEALSEEFRALKDMLLLPKS